MKSDIEIAQACPMRHIREIAREVGVEERYLEQYGNCLLYTSRCV